MTNGRTNEQEVSQDRMEASALGCMDVDRVPGVCTRVTGQWTAEV